MSDRRPSKELYVLRPVPGGVWDYQPADDSEVLARVRRGVESGEIEGEEIVAREAGLIRQGFDPGIYIVIGPLFEEGEDECRKR